MPSGVWNPNSRRDIYDTGRVKGSISDSPLKVLDGPVDGGTRIIGDGAVIYNKSNQPCEFWVFSVATGEEPNDDTKIFGTTIPGGETLSLAPIFLSAGDKIYLSAAANDRLNYFFNYYTEV